MPPDGTEQIKELNGIT